jgi:hypothetical protein
MSRTRRPSRRSCEPPVKGRGKGCADAQDQSFLITWHFALPDSDRRKGRKGLGNLFLRVPPIIAGVGLERGAGVRPTGTGMMLCTSLPRPGRRRRREGSSRSCSGTPRRAGGTTCDYPRRSSGDADSFSLPTMTRAVVALSWKGVQVYRRLAKPCQLTALVARPSVSRPVESATASSRAGPCPLLAWLRVLSGAPRCGP